MGVQSKPEFVYQNCVKIIGHGGAHIHSCDLKSLPIQNTCSIRNFLPTSLTTCYEVKNLKYVQSQVNETGEIFSPTNVCFLVWFIKWSCKQINKRKTFFVTKISFEGCLCVGYISITHRGHLFYFRFMESFWLFTGKDHHYLEVYYLFQNL